MGEIPHKEVAGYKVQMHDFIKNYYKNYADELVVQKQKHPRFIVSFSAAQTEEVLKIAMQALGSGTAEPDGFVLELVRMVDDIELQGYIDTAKLPESESPLDIINGLWHELERTLLIGFMNYYQKSKKKE